jgi:hypothetical protein
MSSLGLWVTPGFMVLVGIPWISTKFDTFLSGAQQDVIDVSMARERRKEAEYVVRTKASLMSQCEGIFKSQICTDPRSFGELEKCLWRLRGLECDNLDGVNLCAAVKELRPCKVPRNDRIAGGCEQLRVVADCAGKPALLKPTHNWSIAVPS